MLLSPQLRTLFPDVFGLQILYSGSKVCAIGHQSLLPMSVPLSPQFLQSAPKSVTTVN